MTKPYNAPFFGCNTIYDRDQAKTPYMTRLWIGRLRLHIFHRGDNDPDPHDHPFHFWTFPLTSYVEEVTIDEGEVEEGYTESGLRRFDVPDGEHSYDTFLRIVPAFRWSYRPAEHTHRVLGRYTGYCRRRDSAYNTTTLPVHAGAGAPPGFVPLHDDGKMITIVWRGPYKRMWGFLKFDGARRCWRDFKSYLSGGGKNAPCE